MTILPPYEAPYKPVPQVAPFTYRDGITMLKKLELLQRYINRELVPFVNDNMEELGDAFETQVNALIDAVNAAIDMVINDSIEVQDPIVAALISDDATATNNALIALLGPIFLDQAEADALYANQKPDSVVVAISDSFTDIQAACDTAFAQGKSVWAGGTVTTDQTLIVRTNADFSSLKLTHTSGNLPAVSVTAPNVAIVGATIIGPGNTAHTSGSRGIAVMGTVETPIKNVTIERCNISGFREGGVWLNFVDGFNISDSVISNCRYAGIHGFSVYNGVIEGCRIDTITATPLAYGITINKAVADLTIAPLSRDVVISNNIVNNVPFWEGIDTHGGVRITIIGNTVTACKIGIACVYAKQEPGDQGMYAPKDVTITGNVIDSLNMLGEADFGISFAGAYLAQGTPIDLATGSIVGNTVRNHGLGSDDQRGAIYIHTTRAVIVSGNTVINPSPNGIVISHTNYDLICSNNVIVENFAKTAPRSMAITIRQAYNYATVVGNRHSASGEHSGDPLVNDNGLRVISGTNNEIIALGNDFASTNTPYSSGTSDAFRIQMLRSGNVGQAAALTAASGATVDTTYGTEERDVINNTRTRVNAIEAVLQNLGLVL